MLYLQSANLKKALLFLFCFNPLIRWRVFAFKNICKKTNKKLVILK